MGPGSYPGREGHSHYCFPWRSLSSCSPCFSCSLASHGHNALHPNYLLLSSFSALRAKSKAHDPANPGLKNTTNVAWHRWPQLPTLPALTNLWAKGNNRNLSKTGVVGSVTAGIRNERYRVPTLPKGRVGGKGHHAWVEKPPNPPRRVRGYRHCRRCGASESYPICGN